MTRSPQEKGLTGAGTQVYTKQQRRTRLHRKRPQRRNLHGARTGTQWQWQACLRRTSPTRSPSSAETMWCGTRMTCGTQQRTSVHTGEHICVALQALRRQVIIRRLDCSHIDSPTGCKLPIQQWGQPGSVVHGLKVGNGQLPPRNTVGAFPPAPIASAVMPGCRVEAGAWTKWRMRTAVLPVPLLGI